MKQMANKGDNSFTDTVVFDQESTPKNVTPKQKRCPNKKEIVEVHPMKKAKPSNKDTPSSTSEPSKGTSTAKTGDVIIKDTQAEMVIEQFQLRKSTQGETKEESKTQTVLQDDSKSLSEDTTENDLTSVHQSLIVNQLFSGDLSGSQSKSSEFKNIEDPQKAQILIEVLYERFNIEKEKNLILQPKFKMPSLAEQYVQPSYYD